MDIDAIKAALALGRLKWGNLDADANTVFEQAEAALASSPAPTGEIAGLVERLNKAAAAITNQREHIRKQAEDIMTLGRLVYPKDGIGADDTWKARCAASEAEAAELRRKLEEHQDAEDKAAREMAIVIQGLRYRAAAAERKLAEARKALEPFATVGEIFDENAGWSDTDEIELSLEDGPRLAVVKLSHFRRARTLSGASE